MHIEPFRIAIPDSDLADLQARLARTRPAPALAGQADSEGIDPDFLARLLAHGAVEVADLRGQYGPGTGWVVLADPEGNEFCILRNLAEREGAGGGQESTPGS